MHRCANSSAQARYARSSSCPASSSMWWSSGVARLRPRLRYLPAAAALGFAVSGCGFRLAGSGTLPGVLARPYLSLKDPYTDFSREFEHQLRSAGAAPQGLAAGSTATIEVSKDLVEHRTLSVSARNIPTEYELTYTVTFAVQGPDQQLLQPQTIN